MNLVSPTTPMQNSVATNYVIVSKEIHPEPTWIGIHTASAAFPPFFRMSDPWREQIELSLATAPSFPGPISSVSRSENSKGEVFALGRWIAIKSSDKTAKTPSLIGCNMLTRICLRFPCDMECCARVGPEEEDPGAPDSSYGAFPY
jgi:hypothetical protein